MNDLNELFSKPISNEVVSFISKLAFTIESLYLAQTERYYRECSIKAILDTKEEEPFF